MFHLNVHDDNDDVLSLHNKTDADHNTCMNAAFHKAV